MAKLALFLPDLSGGGAERSFVNLARGLADRGHSVDLVLSRKSGEYMAEIASNVRLVDLEAANPLLSFWKLSAYLRKEKPAILFSALNQANVAAIWAKKMSGMKIPVAISIRNNLSLEAKNAQGLNLKLMPYFVKTFYPMADEIVSVSAGVADDLAQMTGIPRGRIKVIYNPVVTNDFFAKASQPVDQPWFGADQLPVVLAAGRLNIQKDYKTLIRAFAKVVSKIPARLMILGEGEERGTLNALASELGIAESVAMPGFVENPYAYMSKARLFVLSSLYEGLPGVLIQALASGCPAVSTDCPSGPSEILQNGKFGSLVPVGDVDAMAKAISAALEKPKVSPPAESWQPFLIETATRQYESLALARSQVA